MYYQTVHRAVRGLEHQRSLKPRVGSPAGTRRLQWDEKVIWKSRSFTRHGVGGRGSGWGSLGPHHSGAIVGL